MTKFDKARQWRERHNLSRVQLADLVGYTDKAIYWFERGQSPPNGKSTSRKAGPIAEWVWRRYMMACAGVDAQLDGRKFDW